MSNSSKPKLIDWNQFDNPPSDQGYFANVIRILVNHGFGKALKRHAEYYDLENVIAYLRGCRN